MVSDSFCSFFPSFFFLSYNLHYCILTRVINFTGKENDVIEWCSVRPDTLINGEISEYVITESPTTKITNGTDTTRANVGNFIVRLIENNDLWNEWKFKMPCIKNKIEEQTNKKK